MNCGAQVGLTSMSTSALLRMMSCSKASFSSTLRLVSSMYLPRPTGMRKKMEWLTAPSSWAKSVMSQTSSRFQSTTVVWIWNDRPARLQASMPANVASCAPSTPRKLLCFAASKLSMLMPMEHAPASLSLCATSSVMSVPLLPNTGRRPCAAAWATNSKMSSRISGSPPLKIMILNPARAICSIMALASAVLSSRLSHSSAS